MKLYLAPMEGVFDFHLRHLFSSQGGIDFCVTEFLRVSQDLLPDHVFYKTCPELKNQSHTEHGTPVILQFLGHNNQFLVLNASKAVELGARAIDINFGCPQKKVNAHGAGAVLLKKPDKIYSILSEIKKTIPDSIPLSAKIRIGYKDNSLLSEIVQAIADSGTNFMTVHARTRDEMYHPIIHWEDIARVREWVSLPIIANGEIWTIEDFILCRKITGCNRYMLGRGIFSQPFLALQIKQYLETGIIPPTPTWHRVSQLLSIYFSTLNLEPLHISDKFITSRIKQWTKFLGRNYPEAQILFDKIKLIESTAALQPLIHLADF